MAIYLKFPTKTKFSKLILTNCCRLSTKTAQIDENDEYTKEPQYPPIQEISYPAKKRRERLDWQTKIKNLNTVEEKLFSLNMPRYYGFKCVMLNDEVFHYNSLPFYQYSTRTLMNDNGLPEYYKELDAKVDSLFSMIKSDIEDAVLFEHSGYQTSKKQFSKDVEPDIHRRMLSSRFVTQINRTLINGLIADCPHLSEVEMDVDPRHEAFWFVGGIVPPVRVKGMRQNWQKPYADDPVDRNFCYIGKPLLTLRHSLPLESPMEFEQFPSDVVSSVPQFRLDAHSLGYTHDHRPAITIPGFWPGSKSEFGYLSYQSRHYMPSRNEKYGAEECQENLHSQAIISSFSWLFGQACYQGFSTYHDPTYPLSTQTIITDGKHWSFYVYQLNTTQLHIDAIDSNPKINQCWGTKEMKLYEEIDENGKLIGFNDDVLRNLMKFYISEPKQRDINMKPYLGENEKRVADIENVDRRLFLEERYKFICSARSRHRLIPEVYHWEKIYKVDHNTKPLEPRQRFFELNVNLFQRTLDDHRPLYVPKCIRPGGKKNRNKYAKTYYPLIYRRKNYAYVSTFNRGLVNN